MTEKDRLDLSALRELLNAADLTLPVGMVLAHDQGIQCVVGEMTEGSSVVARLYSEETSRLIQVALNGLPALIDEVEQLREKLANASDAAQVNWESSGRLLEEWKKSAAEAALLARQRDALIDLADRASEFGNAMVPAERIYEAILTDPADESPRDSEPNGCRHDGIGQRDHANRWVEGVGWHTWAEPTGGQRKARMKERRSIRKYLEALNAGLSDCEAREDGWPQGEES